MAEAIGNSWSDYSDTFLLFLLRWAELMRKRYWTEFVPSRLEVKPGPPHDLVNIVSNDIDEDCLISFLAIARQFWIKGDALCIDRVRELLRRVAYQTGDEPLALRLRAIGAEWKARKKGLVVYTCDDGTSVRLSEPRMLEFMFHTKYFHTDVRNAEALLAIEENEAVAEFNKGALEEFVWKFVGYVGQHVPLVRDVILSKALPDGRLRRAFPFSELDFDALGKRTTPKER